MSKDLLNDDIDLGSNIVSNTEYYSKNHIGIIQALKKYYGSISLAAESLGLTTHELRSIMLNDEKLRHQAEHSRCYALDSMEFVLINMALSGDQRAAMYILGATKYNNKETSNNINLLNGDTMELKSELSDKSFTLTFV